MNWEAIGAIGEVLGAVAVFISLSYLALQIKSNTASMEVTSRQSVANEYRDWIRAFHSAEPEHFTRGMSDYPNMPLEHALSSPLVAMTWCFSISQHKPCTRQERCRMRITNPTESG